MAALDQKTYLLNKYLRAPGGDKKKKKKKKHARGSGLRIIDDDMDTSKLQPLDSADVEAFAGDEDAPQIAGIIDERPEHVKTKEQYEMSSKWRVIRQDDGFDSKIQIEEIKKNHTKAEEDNNPIFGKMYSDSEDEKKDDSDLSPPRRMEKSEGNNDKSKNKKIQRHSDSDLSPPRTKNHEKSHNSDQSPPRKAKKSTESTTRRSERSNNSPPRRREKSQERKKHRTSSGSDLSPPRKQEMRRTKEKERKPSRWGHFGPEKPMKPYKEKSDSDASPPRKSRRDTGPREEKRSHRKSNDSDFSPPRKSTTNFNKNVETSSKMSPQRKSRKHSPSRNRSDSDVSPPRRSKKREKSADSDLSLPRNTHNSKHDSREFASNSRNDRSPERLKNRLHDRHKYGMDRRDSDRREERARYNDRGRNSDSPPPTNKKMAKTLEGKLAGLQDANQLRSENDTFRRREDDMYNKMSADVSGKNATTVSRRLEKRETSADREKNREDREKRRELEEKYNKWGKGLKQTADQEARVADYVLEASKPLARHKDDVHLETALKAIERQGDPMLQYMREKKKETSVVPERPSYKGDWPPNRFNIPPGYRWDGVDRSNGYEKKYFDQKSKNKAIAEEAYKWSTEDL